MTEASKKSTDRRLNWHDEERRTHTEEKRTTENKMESET